MSNRPILAVTDKEILECFPVMHELRPHLDQGEFVTTVSNMAPHGYQLLYIRDQADEVAAVAGFRISHNLFMGKHLYIDDLVTSADKRSQGYGEQLLSWLRKLARSENCAWLHLDSGTQREQAHKFYFREGMTITSFHFSESLE